MFQSRSGDAQDTNQAIDRIRNAAEQGHLKAQNVAPARSRPRLTEPAAG